MIKKAIVTFLIALTSITSLQVFAGSHEAFSVKTHAGYRNYYRALTASEEEDIMYILKTLAKKNMIQLLKYKSKLESAGSRIDSIHPLSFLAHIFQNEELKAYFHSLKKRGGWVWDEFASGFKSSLNEEAHLDNLNDAMIDDFAQELKLNPDILYDTIKKRQWDAFIKLLIVNLPREDGGDRYDL